MILLGLVGWAGMPGLSLVPSAAAAEIPKLLMHLVPAADRPGCLDGTELPNCDQIVVAGDMLVEQNLCLLAADIEATAGIGGATLVLESSSTNPASLEFVSWTSWRGHARWQHRHPGSQPLQRHDRRGLPAAGTGRLRSGRAGGHRPAASGFPDNLGEDQGPVRGALTSTSPASVST